MSNELDIEAIKARLAAATPGPWFAQDTDDRMCMSLYAVTTDNREPWVDLPEKDNGHGHVVALTLLQSPRYATHGSGKYEENTTFIAHAPRRHCRADC